ncbi:hypothetical protein [Alteromonas sp. CYL-A6]|uniref:hypothetical protein n=1 Tax=Alteromonas nitratireducens TaxID=3390813 RepID=UPI0034A84750
MDFATEFEKLINDSPVDEAGRHHNEEHLKRLVAEELEEAKASNVINTDRYYRTSRITSAAMTSVNDRIGRWVSARNDLIVKVQGKLGKNMASGADTRQQEILKEKEEKKSQARETYMHDTHYADKESSYLSAKDRFETMRDEHGGKPPVKKRTWLYVFSILGIGFIEWFINFSTFNTKYPEGIAFGMTVLVALAIAFASHFHGALIKQRIALFATYRTISQKRQIVLWQLIMTLLLFIALAVVTYARYDVLSESMFASGASSLPSLPGQEVEEASIWSELWPFVLMNFVVYLIGIAISYITHDSEPDYQEAEKDYQKAKALFFKAKDGLLAEERRIDAEYENKLSAIKNTQKASTAEQQNIAILLERLAKREESLIKQVVSYVNDSLEKHQMMLVAALRANQLEDTRFGPDLLTLSQYQKTIVKIDEQYVREKLTFTEV